MPKIELYPLGKKIDVAVGTPLQDVLFDFGVEFPCGGKGRCKGCRVRVIRGELEISADQQLILGDADYSKGWRLACRSRVIKDVTLELAQWRMPILEDQSRIEGTGKSGLGIAVDLGTTTLATQLINLRDGSIQGVVSGLNSQGRYGADIMTRLEFALANNGAQVLREMIRRQIGEYVDSLIEQAQADRDQIQEIVIVGNSVMHHLFCGVDVAPLSKFPFETAYCQTFQFTSRELSWNLSANPRIRFLPCLGGFVGSDILAGILATGIYNFEEVTGLIDLGTNGEIVFGNRERILVASTAAGPAFEGAKIAMGMRATLGAIAHISLQEDKMSFEVIGGKDRKATGICGSGLVDAVTVALRMKKIDTSGKITNGYDDIGLLPPVRLTQRDIRELQLAKAAIAAGIEILLKNFKLKPDDINKLYFSGAFGNYIDTQSAVDIGLIPLQREKIEAAGNSALRGAKLALFNDDQIERIVSITRHIPLAEDPEFQDIFVDNITFPVPTGRAI